MTDRAEAKRKERARAKAGWKFCSGYTTIDKAASLQAQLKSAEEVDAEIQEKEERFG